MNKSSEIFSKSIPDQEAANELLAKLFDASSPKAVYSDPIESGDYKVVTASEMSIGLGFGYGGGGKEEKVEKDVESDEVIETENSVGQGGGGGGGGFAVGRPVAAIEIGPHGIRVEPIVDPTKIALAFFTTLVSMFAMMRRMRRIGK